MLAYVIQQSESVLHIDISILILDFFPYRSLQPTEWSSLGYTIDSNILHGGQWVSRGDGRN